ncbi:hypothetical protein PIB30_107279 [Stylosanthes scabra]|uniref:Uncharacterized protein n=1 Tax=Stylosanthes scabra TaxID=79078 RepID=A0ABU6VXM4_9FABA|nr:hypothetical protein [Stylosanthes scabra]
MEMSSSSMKREESDERRITTTTTAALYNPCYLLEEALNALLKCLGFETATTTAENKKNNNVHLKPHSDADLDGDDMISTPQVCECHDTNMKGSYQEDEQDPPASSTSQDGIITTDANMGSRRRPGAGGGGRPGLSGGPGPQHN